MSSPEFIVQECRRRQSREDAQAFSIGVMASWPLVGPYNMASTPQEQYEADELRREDDEAFGKLGINEIADILHRGEV